MVTPWKMEWVQGQREFRKKGIKNVGDGRRECKRNWTAGGAEDPPRAATFPKLF